MIKKTKMKKIIGIIPFLIGLILIFIGFINNIEVPFNFWIVFGFICILIAFINDNSDLIDDLQKRVKELENKK